MKKYLLISVLLFLALILESCCNFQGSHDLGNNFALLEGDTKEDRIIIFCSPRENDSCCRSGLYVLPTYENHYDEKGNYLEYVVKAESDNNWIIIKTNKKASIRYWFLNKNFELDQKFNQSPLPRELADELKEILNSQIIGPLDLKDFKIKKQEIGIDLKFE